MADTIMLVPNYLDHKDYKMKIKKKIKKNEILKKRKMKVILKKKKIILKKRK